MSASGDVVRILPYTSRYVGGRRSAWVFMPGRVSGAPAPPVVYVLDGHKHDSGCWDVVDAVDRLLNDATRGPTLEPAVLVIPLAGASVRHRTALSLRKGLGKFECYAAEVFEDLVPTVERHLSLPIDPMERTVVTMNDTDPVNGAADPDDLITAVCACNRLLPTAKQFRVVRASQTLTRLLPALLCKPELRQHQTPVS